MPTLKVAVLTVLAIATPLAAQAQAPAQTSGALEQTVAKVVAREKQEMATIRKYSPLVETYIQKVRASNDETWVPAGDHYFIGRADFAKGADVIPLQSNAEASPGRSLLRLFDFGTEFLPKGFLQMIFLDNSGLDAQRYRFDFVRREFLGEVRTLVFDVTPNKPMRGRFVGRIWVEDQEYTIVRFNGSYAGIENAYMKFHFDSWRVNAGPNLWLPAFIYTEEDSAAHPTFKTTGYKAQTRLWGYNTGDVREEQELSKVLVESSAPIVDKSVQNNDLSPVQEVRAWGEQADDNVIDKMERLGLVAPKGDVDKLLDTVINNLEITNNLTFDPEIHCRVLMTSTLESFALGNTIVLSRGLIDVLPDEPSLAAILSKELAYIIVAPSPADRDFAFYDRLAFDQKTAFQHFDFAHNPKDEAAANAKAIELLQKSPYKNQLATARLFIDELQARQHEIPSLISARVGDAALVETSLGSNVERESAKGQIVALPLGARVKFDPWDDTLQIMKTQPISAAALGSKMPFEVTPFVLYLTRQNSESPKTSELNVPAQPGLP